MTDRLLVFSNPEVQKLLKEKFIPVACNDWYQRRRQDAEGEFFRSVANQGPRKGQGGMTRQGHYVLTAGGKLLGFNNNRGAERRLKMMKSALAKWDSLPASEKDTKVPAHGKLDSKYHRALPDGAQVIKVTTRALEYDSGKYSPLKDEIPGKLAAIDHLWIKKNELKSLTPDSSGPLPNRLAMRIARYHLLDSTRGEPPFWKKNDIKTLSIYIDKIGIITGKYQLETTDGKRGYNGSFKGVIKFDSSGKLTDFQMLAMGKHWGEGRYTGGARPGKTPLAVYFDFVEKPQAADLIPPQGIHWEQGYWQAEK
ncbi:MAG: hypothetical protein AB8F34_00605 [Akkermansiaceae bacterium]